VYTKTGTASVSDNLDPEVGVCILLYYAQYRVLYIIYIYVYNLLRCYCYYSVPITSRARNDKFFGTSRHLPTPPPRRRTSINSASSDLRDRRGDHGIIVSGGVGGGGGEAKTVC